MTIEQAVQDYLQDQSSHHRRPKTLQWHQLVSSASKGAITQPLGLLKTIE
jgi:hypothetical protein